MEKERMNDSGRGRMTDMPIIPGWIEKRYQYKYTTTGMYPEEDDIANALFLVCLMINKNRLRIDCKPMITKIRFSPPIEKDPIMQTYKTVAEVVDFLETYHQQLNDYFLTNRDSGHTANLLAAASIDLYNKKEHNAGTHNLQCPSSFSFFVDRN